MAKPTLSNLRIGTSGWNYPAGKGTWNGIFYPSAGPAKSRGGAGRGAPAPKFDELAFYAEHFDTVEINTTFYGQPKPDIAAGWARRTPQGFEFSLKLYRKFTHPAMYEKATGRADAHSDVPGVPILDETEIDVFRRGIEPLADAGKVGALLAQFPPSFKQSPQSRDYLDALLSRFSGYPVAVELRHRSWSDDFAATLTLLNSHNAALTQIDEPKFQVSIRQNQLPNISGFYYMRLHGRNAAQWWTHDKSEDRYNYLYSADELAPIAETADAARRLVKKFYLYFNNHFSAKAVANAVMIKRQLGEPIDGLYPPAFLEAYPHLKGVVKDYTEAWMPAPVRHESR
ncbi:MAG TPA: DUF72 domain-containing protein [Vicinamibacterales bacterium]|jgi:uncharacterized protein YecE (DUF72 family)|nr:DUF72 domain-containing protein [Vicinamibacterales bacterium]